jgi:hypothetical protein
MVEDLHVGRNWSRILALTHIVLVVRSRNPVPISASSRRATIVFVRRAARSGIRGFELAQVSRIEQDIAS